jgi:hypothetical protein
MSHSIADNSQQRIPLRSYRNARYWMNDSEKSVKRHQHQCVDARVTCDDNHVLNLRREKKVTERKNSVIYGPTSVINGQNEFDVLS